MPVTSLFICLLRFRDIIRPGKSGRGGVQKKKDCLLVAFGDVSREYADRGLWLHRHCIENVSDILPSNVKTVLDWFPQQGLSASSGVLNNPREYNRGKARKPWLSLSPIERRHRLPHPVSPTRVPPERRSPDTNLVNRPTFIYSGNLTIK